MLEGLFGDDNGGGTTSNSSSSKASAEGGKPSVSSPPPPRLPSGLAGIQNQGATCYMNALLQSLLFTPEFRKALFQLDQTELGNLEDRSKPGAKVRVIPIQLQKLFARLLLVETQCIGTQDLTDSFGWTNNEELQQHDVQELNRILFSAVEDSLIGTSGQSLISQFYHGNIVNQISCDECGRISEREEDFLDLTLAVAGYAGVKDSLESYYVTKERMEGDNRYRCERCNKLVNASKGAKLRSLPPILTLSLLRFSYDFNRGQRYKEMGCYTFPLELDMSPYCEQTTSSDSSLYELFSVVIHGGSTHGGHYHAYIRDVDSLGTWTKPEDEPIQLPNKKDADSEPVGVIELNSPEEILALLLRQHGGPQCSMYMDELCQALCRETGVSWNKRFKKQYGPINKFIRLHDEMFTFTTSTNSVSLKDSIISENEESASGAENAATCQKEGNNTDEMQNHRNNSGNQDTRNDIVDEVVIGGAVGATSDDTTASCKAMTSDTNNRSITKTPGRLCCEKHRGAGDSMLLQCAKCRAERTKSTNDLSSSRGKCWFDFNDAKVHPITAKAIDRQFSGRESAYMLFYRSKSLYRPIEAQCNKLHGIPEWLLAEMRKENEMLEKQRLEYEAAINRIELVILQSHHYVYNRGALHPRPSLDVTPKKLGLDRRKTIEEFITDIRMLLEDKGTSEDTICLHIGKQLPAGLHLFNSISEDKASTLQGLGITDGTQVFVWDGKQVDGMPIRTGEKCEPVLLNITYECHEQRTVSQQNGTKQIQHTFPKDCTLSEIRAMVSVLTDIPARCLLLSRVGSKSVVLETKDNAKTLEELQLCDHDSLVAEYQRDTGTSTSLAEQETEKQNKMVSFTVENRCAGSLTATVDWPTQQVQIEHDKRIDELKFVILQKFNLAGDKMMKRVCRLRVNHDTLGLQAPLYEEETVSSAGLTQGCEIVLEPGRPPKNNQITLTFSAKSGELSLTHEVTVERNITVAECLQVFLERANIESDSYHLRRTNWCHEPGGLLIDVDATLEQENISNGDFLILEEGKLAPKGFVFLPIWLYPSPDRGHNSPADQNGVVSRITTILSGLLSKETTNGHSDNDIISDDVTQGAMLGEIEISLDATVEDLKIQILTLKHLDDLTLPTPDFLRVRLIENKRLTRILKEYDQPLKRLKVTRFSHLAVQVLPEEEELKANSIVLNICQRIAQTRTYTPIEELTWEAGKAGNPETLRQIIADRMLIPIERVAIAKHLPEKFEWLVINSKPQSSPSRGKGKKKGSRTHIVNLKHAPYHLKDGDLIAIKDLQFDSLDQDDFTTEDDDIGKEHVRLMAEEKRQKRREMKKNNSNWQEKGGSGSKQKDKRHEHGLAIHVDDFRTEAQQT